MQHNPISQSLHDMLCPFDTDCSLDAAVPLQPTMDLSNPD
jgi:hypothetical protein